MSFFPFNNFILPFALLFVFISCEREISVSPPDEPPPDGFIEIDSYPDSSRIFLNGRDRLRSTPDSLRFLATDAYRIMLRKEFFLDTSFTVDVVEGERTNIFVDYTANPRMLGSMTLNSKPEGAEIFINDSSTSQTTPHTFQSILPGRYKVTYKYENHRDNNFNLIVRSSELTDIKKTMVDTTVWSSFNTEDSEIPSNELTTIVVDHFGLFWIGSNDGLIRYDNSSWQLFTESNSELPYNKVNAIAVDSKNIKWIATDKHLGLANNNTVFAKIISNTIKDPSATGLSTFTFFDVTILRGDEDLILFTSDIGIVMYPSIPLWNMFNFASNLTSVVSTRFGVMYGTSDRGIGIGPATFYSRPDTDIPSNNVSSLAEASEGVWIGHLNDVGRTGGLSLYDGKSFQTFKFATNKVLVKTVFVDSKNQKWIGTNIGLYKFSNFDDRKFIDYEYSGLPLENITGFAEDDSGNIWITSEDNGLFLFKDGINR